MNAITGGMLTLGVLSSAVAIGTIVGVMPYSFGAAIVIAIPFVIVAGISIATVLSFLV